MPTDKINTRSVTIANGASLSGALSDLDGQMVVGLVMPAGWTAANLTFQSSHDDSAYADVYDDGGTEINIPTAASRNIKLRPSDWIGWTGLKVRSGTSATPVTQGADRIITFILISQ